MNAQTFEPARNALMLTELRLPTMGRLWEEFAQRSDKEGWPAGRFLSGLLEHELAERRRIYSDYLLSPEWAKRREKVLRRANGICEGCGEARATQVHHKTYDHIYNEPLFDLVAICKACHESIHQAGAA